ncbi:hypothetical protein BURK2_04123 [Burkholderiales bacterium]|nr:hypothetical protein BURK2_04123 [Burkholderiales bacterium]
MQSIRLPQPIPLDGARHVSAHMLSMIMEETTSAAIGTPKVILRLPKVMKRTGLARSTIYKLIDSKDFPAQVKLTRHAVGWYESEIEAWMGQRSSQGRP